MANREEKSGELEWRIQMPDGKSKVLEPESHLLQRTCSSLKSFAVGFVTKIWMFLVKSWNIGVDDPKKFVHCVKVGLALSVVSLFYYMRPLYDGVGGNAMWAVMTVVVALEYTVGATLCKCINRAMATAVAGSLGIGIHWVASQTGEKFEPIIIGTSVFIFAAATTFSRFIPAVKARFDYGALIFILTFSLVSVSGYRVDKLWTLAHQRVSTIAIGTSLCVLVSMLFCPVWAGYQLHQQTIRNLENLANSLKGHVAKYFTNEEASTIHGEINKKIQGYKCVLNSKQSEESMVNFAKWEPAHGKFSFGYPWKQYLKIGAAARKCAYCIDNINSCINSEMQAPEYLKKHIEEECMRLSSYSSEVLKELAITIKTMKTSSEIELLVGDMNFAVQELHNALKALPSHFTQPQSPPQTVDDHPDADPEGLKRPAYASIIEILPLAALVTLLTETVVRTEETVDAVNELASLAEFQSNNHKKSIQNQPTDGNQDHQSMKILQRI
ncbi:hypothetical protein Nepgr_024376 [Nepenthes gracilis]|uniref:Aluminum-activated malate transporter 10 n=1 Tax=Nepenthes gracilis TaxID=150966 RepID=A0AAD3T2Q5_NEPGR|nr:hypothetical protein Nepgr_024376 [Nepenthes gracilis]